MVDGFRVHRLDETEFVGDARYVGQQFTDPRSALSVLLEFEQRRDHREAVLGRRHSGEALALADGRRQVFAANLGDHGQVRLEATARADRDPGRAAGRTRPSDEKRRPRHPRAHHLQRPDRARRTRRRRSRGREGVARGERPS